MASRRRNIPERVIQHRNTVSIAKNSNNGLHWNKRGRVSTRDERVPFLPPEDWHEPTEIDQNGYQVIIRNPGKGYRHVVSEAEIRERLSRLPQSLVRPLDVVQLSEMTRKKRTFPCYGMQWGTSVYLYPIEESYVEYFDRPPKPQVFNEARMFGGRWEEASRGHWRLIWTEATLRDFYLNNILIHELGHLLDNRNTRYVDRERFAEWFAIEHGYKPSRRKELANRIRCKRTKRRHHST